MQFQADINAILFSLLLSSVDQECEKLLVRTSYPVLPHRIFKDFSAEHDRFSWDHDVRTARGQYFEAKTLDCKWDNDDRGGFSDDVPLRMDGAVSLSSCLNALQSLCRQS